MSDSEFTVCVLMTHCQLGEEVCNQQVTDIHLDEIASSYCRHWRTLRAELGLEAIVEHDIDRSIPGDEEGRRRAFFNKWKLMKGSSATYKALISALLRIKCRDDAEGVCKLLKKSQAKEEKSCHAMNDCGEGSCQAKQKSSAVVCPSHKSADNIVLLQEEPGKIIDRVCNMKNQPPSFGKLTFIPCRTPWYLNKRTLKVQILQLVWQKCSQGQRLS